MKNTVATEDKSAGSADLPAVPAAVKEVANLAETVAIAANEPLVGNHSAAPPATPGSLLKLAREHSGLSLGDIASRLRMSVSQIDALEHDDYSKLPTGTFLRGFVRNYAKVVNVNNVLVMESLERTHTGTGDHKNKPPIIAYSQNIKFSTTTNHYNTHRARLLLISVLSLALLIAVVYWWSFIRTQDGKNEVVPEPDLVLQSAKPAAADNALPIHAETNADPVPDTAVAVTAPNISVLPATPAPLALPPLTNPILKQTTPALMAKNLPAIIAETEGKAAKSKKNSIGSGVLGFSFSGDSWVEVTDAEGNIVVSKHFKAGDIEEFTGRQPLSVVIGNASATRMAHNGKEFALEPYTKLSVARVKLP